MCDVWAIWFCSKGFGFLRLAHGISRTLLVGYLLYRYVWTRVTSGFRHSVNEICTLLCCYAVQICSFGTAYRFHLQAPSSPLKMDRYFVPKRLWLTTNLPYVIFLKSADITRRPQADWKGREEGEDPGKDGKRKLKEIFKCWEWEDGESWLQIGKNGRTLFDRPKPTVGCSANGRRHKAGVH